MSDGDSLRARYFVRCDRAEVRSAKLLALSFGMGCDDQPSRHPGAITQYFSASRDMLPGDPELSQSVQQEQRMTFSGLCHVKPCAVYLSHGVPNHR